MSNQADGIGELTNVPNSPYFFFSYAHADWDEYMERFFLDLNQRLRRLLGAGDEKVSFLDSDSVKTGQDWNSRISGAVALSRVLVCIYTPNFFSKAKMHEYCAKEFDAFLKRHRDLRYEQVVHNGRVIFQIRNARNIIPVLWMGEADLSSLGLPPPALATITYTLNQLNAQVDQDVSETYRAKGLEQITRRRRQSTYFEIVLALARLIRDSAADALPPMQPPPDFNTLRNAFWEPPEGMGDSGVLPSPAPGGPRQILAIAIRSSVGHESEWAPYAGEPNLSGIVEEIATRARLIRTWASLDPLSPESLRQAEQALRDRDRCTPRPVPGPQNRRSKAPHQRNRRMGKTTKHRRRPHQMDAHNR